MILLFACFVVWSGHFIPPALSQNMNDTLWNIENTTWTSNTTVSIQTDSPSFCSAYKIESGTKLKGKLKAEPKCTESGAILDQLFRFIGYQFDRHDCGNQESARKFRDMLYCTMQNTHMQCLQSSEGEIMDTAVPEISDVEEVIRELCAANKSLERDCMFKTFKYVSRCIAADVNSILQSQGRQWTYGALDPCRHMEVKIMCMWEELQKCGEVTAGIMAGLVGSQLSPDACNFSSAIPSQPSIYLSLTAFLTVSILKTAFIL